MYSDLCRGKTTNPQELVCTYKYLQAHVLTRTTWGNTDFENYSHDSQIVKFIFVICVF